MFAGIRRFFKRHERKFVIGGAIVGGIVIMSRYTQRKLREWQETEIKAIMDRTKKRHHFDYLERTCNHITVILADKVRETVIKELDTEQIIKQLKDGDNSNKLYLWQRLKILSITRTAAIIYTYTMLVTFIRIQINLISGYTYINQTVDNIAGHNIQAKYLQLSSYFISEGVQRLCRLLEDTVSKITKRVSLNDKLTLRDLEQIYWSITSSVFADSSNDPIKNFASYTMLQQCDKKKESFVYAAIIDQTLDLLESEEVQNLTQRNVRSGFASLIDHISVYYGAPPKNKNESEISLPGTSGQENKIWTDQSKEVTSNGSNELIDNKVSIPLAKMIPILSGQVPDEPTSKDASAVWLQRLMLNNEIKMLAANVYEAFSSKTCTP